MRGDRDAARAPRGAVRRVVTALLTVGVVVLVVLTVARAVPYDRVGVVAQAASLTPWVALAGVVGLVLTLVARARVLALVTAVALVPHVVWLAPFFVPGPGLGDEAAGVPAPGTLRVMSVNALYGQADAEQVVELVREHDVELLSIVELTEPMVRRLSAAGLEDVLPYWVGDPPEGGADGSGLWSATGLTDLGLAVESSFDMPTALLTLDGVEVRVTAVHPVPPVGGHVGTWADELERLAEQAHADPRAQILLGDFNATHDHASFRSLLGDRFSDATRAAGRGLNPSWPSDSALPLLVDLDHVVIDEGMAVADVESVKIRGSDHRALLATVRVTPAGDHE